MSIPALHNSTGKVGPNLLDTYLAQREAMVRFFRARMGAEADIEDLLQELYFKVADLDAVSGTASPAARTDDIQNPKAYLYRLAANLLIDRWRAWQRSRVRESRWHDEGRTTPPLSRRTAHPAAHSRPGFNEDVDDAPSPEVIVINRDTLDKIVRIVRGLPDKTQTIFCLHKLEGLSHAEVAARMGISRSTVEKHMMDALRALDERLAR